jgi:hypothetical protein
VKSLPDAVDGRMLQDTLPSSRSEILLGQDGECQESQYPSFPVLLHTSFRDLNWRCSKAMQSLFEVIQLLVLVTVMTRQTLVVLLFRPVHFTLARGTALALCTALGRRVAIISFSHALLALSHTSLLIP